MNNFNSLLKENPKPTPQMVEDNFDGNICRCTGKRRALDQSVYTNRLISIHNIKGYRPILDAMKSFAVKSECNEYTPDIEVSWSTNIV